MKKHALIYISFSLLSFLITSHTSAYYDSFDNAPLNKEKWRTLETARNVSDGKLHLKFQNCDIDGAVAITPTATGTSSIKTTVLVDSDSYVPDDGTSVFRMVGSFFNDSRGPGSGQDYDGVEGETWARIEIGLGEGGTLIARASAWRWNDPDGNGTTELFDQNFTTTLALDTEHQVSVEYTGSSFVFKCNSDEFTHPISGLTFEPMQNQPWLYLMYYPNDTGECSYLKTQIDDFYNDNSLPPYDTFDGNQLDTNKWEEAEIIREILDGKLRMKVGNCNYSANSSASPTATNESGYLESKVAVNGGSVSQGNTGFAGISSYFYNEKRGPGSGLAYNGYQDNVRVSNHIRLDENGTLRAYALAWRSDHPEEEDGTVLFGESFNLPIEFGQEPTLSIRFSGSQIIYKCNNETKIYQVLTPIYESYDKNYYLQSRVYNGDQQCGFVDATFDDLAIIPLDLQELIIQPSPEDGVDVWIDSSFHGGGDDWGLRIGGWADWYYSLIRFNIDSLPPNVISAKIEIHSLEGYDQSDMYLDRVDSYWDETLRWVHNGPAYTNIRTIPPSTDSGWYAIDITDLYHTWKDGTDENHGIQLRPTRNNHTFTNFYSSDYMDDPSLRPKLVIVAEVFDADDDGLYDEVDMEPLVPSTRFSDIPNGGVTSGQIVGLDAGITVVIMDVPDPSGVKLVVSGPANGLSKIKIDGSHGLYKLSPGQYILTSGSVSLQCLTGTAEAEFTIEEKMIVVLVEGIAVFNETITNNELMELVVQTVEGNVTMDGEVLPPGQTLTVMSVLIDIKPGSDPNCINNDGHGVIPIAILSTADFDATQVDPATVSLDGQAVKVVGKGKTQAHIEDVNGDGMDDLVAQIEDTDGTYQTGDTLATLTANTFDGMSIVGTDTLCIVP